ncbi:RNA polymerase sigma-70 factor, ECF subfamily [Candidatus Thermokryptus mobilis]|uniref:RNA polymerase sigma-70 factor, ECF subfamily n=2 Tax=Candidatus Thermokryptus mobilis TaxID=1643428 RepID=A0A0S4MWD5_9BACT|nr:RNA polymerase sigma-70 factor, ECF subfamily [Candidatus Thermokryptus mobilis]
MEGTNDREIIERIRNGDESAFEEIYERLKLPLYKFCLRMISDEETAFDIVHDVFLKFYERLNTIDQISSVSSLLFKIARNKCLNYLRDKKEKVKIEETEIISEDNLERKIDLNENTKRLQRILNLLDEDYREILILREWNNLSYNEIAEITGLTVPAVKSKLFKARKKLVEIFKKYYGDDIK